MCLVSCVASVFASHVCFFKMGRRIYLRVKKLLPNSFFTCFSSAC